MIKLVNEDPLKYEDKKGNEVEILNYICPDSGLMIKYCVDNGINIPVFIPAKEVENSAWREVLRL